MRIRVLNGPNLNLLGQREPEIYGKTTLDEIHQEMMVFAERENISLLCLQSNYEGQLIDWIQEAFFQQDAGLIFNPGALTHTSIALADALKAVKLPCIEVHLSNIYARESFRHHSYISPVVLGTISGLGVQGYFLALQSLLTYLKST